MNRKQQEIEARRLSDLTARELEEAGAGRDDIDYATDDLPTARRSALPVPPRPSFSEAIEAAGITNPETILKLAQSEAEQNGDV